MSARGSRTGFAILSTPILRDATQAQLCCSIGEKSMIM
jgi:hypothetical protein